MSEEIELGIKFKADGSGLVGEVKLSENELKKLGRVAKDSSKDMNVLARGSDLAKQKLEGLRNKSRSLYSALFSLKGLIATVGVGAMAKSFLDAASTAEQYRVRLKVLLGDVTEGNRLFQQMSLFASKVPFEYREIMAAATALAGVLAGGVNEISAWMPLIGDLAAASGLGIQQTTDQVIRMLSAGAASADLFRERGILAMLGFQAGVTYSGEQTRDQLIAAWGDVSSKFRGATEELAASWDGKMSMLSDKWFAFRNQIMDAGLFDYLKAMASTLDNDIGNAMDNNKDQAKAWSDAVISGIETVIKALDIMLEVWNKILIGLKTIQLGFQTIKFAALSVIDAFPEDSNEPLAKTRKGRRDQLNQRLESRDYSASHEAAARMEELNAELTALINSPDNFDADAKIAQIRDNLKATANNAKTAGDNTDDLKAKVDALNNSKVENNNLSKEEEKYLDDILKAGDRVAKQQRKEIEARKKALQDRVSQLNESLLDETEAENKRYRDSLSILKRAEEQKLDTIMSYTELRSRLETEHQENLQAIRDEATADQRAKLEEEAKRQAEIMQEPFKNALRGIQGSFTNFYEDLFSGGVNSFSDLASSAKKIFIRLAAEIATLMTFKPIVGSLLGGSGIASQLGVAGSSSLGSNFLSSVLSNPLGGAGSGGAIGGIGGGLLSLGSSLVGNFSSLLAGAGSPSLSLFGAGIADFLGLGAGGTVALGNAFGFSPYGAIGGLAANLFGIGGGGLVGTGLSTAGSLLGGAFGGPIGAGIGGFLGSAIGGLFGGGETPHLGGAATTNLAGGGITLHGSGPQGAEQFNKAITDELNNFASTIGANVLDSVRISTTHYSNYGEIGAPQFISFSSAYTEQQKPFYFGGATQLQGNDPQDTAMRAVTSLLASGKALTGLSPTLSNVLQKSASNNRSDLEQIFDDLNFAAGLLGETLGGDGGASASLSGITTQFEEMKRRAQDLGLPLEKINEGLKDQLNVIENNYLTRLKTIEQSANQLLGINYLNSFKTSLQTSELSGLSAKDRFNASNQQFNDLSQLALGGDLAAIQSFPAIAQQTLSLGRDVFASGSAYQELFKSVNDTLNKIIEQQENIRGTFNSDELQIAIKDATEEQIAALHAEFEELKDAVESVRREIGSVAA